MSIFYRGRRSISNQARYFSILELNNEIFFEKRRKVAEIKFQIGSSMETNNKTERNLHFYIL